MAELPQLTRRLRTGFDLTEGECVEAATSLTLAEVPGDHKKQFLEALHSKGETITEVTAFARVFRSLARDPQLADVAGRAIDIVGTGGSGSRGFNVSSVTAFIVAASGTPVLKHGNRAITSQSGSADFLAAYGIRMDTEPELLRAAVKELNFCFFFAPSFHPAFKEIMPVRKELAAQGKRTIFNILGPLINPARPAHQLLGVLAPQWVQPLAGVLGRLGLTAGLAACCELSGGGHMDELATAGVNVVRGFGRLENLDTRWTPQETGFPPCAPEELAGGTAAENVALLEEIVRGRGRQGLADTLVLNAAAAFLILGVDDSLGEGCARAREILLGGTLRTWLDKARAFYATNQTGA